MYTIQFVSFVVPVLDFTGFFVGRVKCLGKICQVCQGTGQIMAIPKLAFEKWRFRSLKSRTLQAANKVGRYRNWAKTMPSLRKTHDNLQLTKIAELQRMFDECKSCNNTKADFKIANKYKLLSFSKLLAAPIQENVKRAEHKFIKANVRYPWIESA